MEQKEMPFHSLDRLSSSLYSSKYTLAVYVFVCASIEQFVSQIRQETVYTRHVHVQDMTHERRCV